MITLTHKYYLFVASFFCSHFTNGDKLKEITKLFIYNDYANKTHLLVLDNQKDYKRLVTALHDIKHHLK